VERLVEAIKKSKWEWKVECSYVSIAGGRLYHLNIGEEGRRLTHIAVQENGDYAWEAIDKLFSSKSKTARLWAISFFGQNHLLENPKRILPFLDDSDEDIVQSAIEALRDMKAKSAAAPIKRVMTGKQSLVTRMFAAWALNRDRAKWDEEKEQFVFG
jgi:HEAT repeat protein